MKYCRKYAMLILTAMAACVGWTAYATSRDGRGDADARKSRYYYFEGLRHDLSGNQDAAYECYRKAVALDSTNQEAQYQMATTRMGILDMELRSPAEVQSNLARMRGYVDAYPDDGDENLFYGYLASMNDTTDEGIRVLERLADLQPDNTSTLIYLSQAYANAGKNDKAIEAMNRYEQAEGINSPLSMHKMSLYMEAGDTLGAIKEVDRLIEHDPRDYRAMILKGNLYEVIGQPDSAEYYYLKSERLEPEASGPKIALMEVYRTKGDSTAYDAKVYEVLLTEDMEIGDKTRLLADYLQKLLDNNNDTSRGDYLFGVLESQYPHDPEVLDLAARYSYAKGDCDGAAEKVSYALDMDRGNIDLWRKLMYYQVNGEKFKEAISTYEKADKEGIPDKSMRLYIAMVYQQDKQYTKADSLYKRVIADIDSGLNPDTKISLSDVRRDITIDDLDFLSQVFTSRGDNSYAASDTLGAFRDYENALTLNSDNSMAANNYAYFSIENGGDLAKAEELSRRTIVGDNAKNPTFLDTYAWILFLRGDTDKAIEYQMRAVEEMEAQGREESVIYDHYADMLEKKGFMAEALKYRRLAAEQAPDDATIKAKLENAEKAEKQKKK